MSSKTTIADLGIENSVRYALDQEILDRSLLVEGALVSPQAQIEVNLPVYTPFLETLIKFKREETWAAIKAPPEYNVQKRRLFTTSIIPSLGSEDYLQIQMEKVKNQHDKQKMQRAGEKGASAWEQQRVQNEEDKESDSILTLMKQIQTLDRDVRELNTRRNQYQKG